MKYLFVLLLVTTNKATLSQSKLLDTRSDTSFWFQLKLQDAKRIGLPDLTITSDSLHFRYWMENQAIEIWTNDYKTFYGNISNHTETIQNNEKNRSSVKAAGFYSNKTELTPLHAKEVFELFERCHLFQLPSDKNIKGWVQGDDGEELLFEFSTRHYYSFTTFWTPSAQENVPEAVTLNKLNQELRSLLNLNLSWNTFLSSLPNGCYRHGEMMIVCKAKSSHKIGQ
jgi:hypothetical protein